MADVELVLLQRVEKLGQMGDVVKVKPGFARNYLLPMKRALRATKENLARFEQERAQLEAQNLKRREEAERVASALLEPRLAACVNLLPGVTSLFWWEGKIDRAEEVLLLVKTRRSLMPALLEQVRAIHSYDVFEAVALPIVAGSPEYLRWLEETTSAGDREG